MFGLFFLDMFNYCRSSNAIAMFLWTIRVFSHLIFVLTYEIVARPILFSFPYTDFYTVPYDRNDIQLNFAFN